MSGLLGCCLVAVTAGADDLSLSARIDAKSLIIGSESQIVLEWKLSEGTTASKAGIPAPVLQIQVPGAVRLSGKYRSEYRELAQNEFLHTPFEQLLENSPTRIGFTLIRRLLVPEQINLNVLAYVSSADGKDVRYVRRRLKLAVEAGAVAESVEADNSDWGVENLLQIGSTAAGFELPRADGSTVTLSQYLGKKNVIVTTYRAHW